ncbi:Myeloid leukemia factor 2 [Microtus ochrogaster]|uniref:Myeloid leukemia factor 2 n=1 Tax=Microtus ochrogaster TaxID=79684 RepID=A0A8J6GXD0_MICOH|nr:Myeloid leukemia factor 2 [Microtus ochrogaster]
MDQSCILGHNPAPAAPPYTQKKRHPDGVGGGVEGTDRVEPPGAEIRMFSFMKDKKPEDPMFLMDPFAIHRQHMRHMLLGGFGYSPFLSITDGNTPATRPASHRMQAGAVSPFEMLGMSGGFMDMVGT